MTPRFSIITPSFQQAQFLPHCIASVAGQQYPQIEHIIVDGGSSDGTVEILRQHRHLTWVSEPDSGQAEALNKALALSTGEYIGWLNADDMYAIEALPRAAAALAKSPVVIGGVDLCDAEGKCFQHLKNNERTWFDTLKYWVPYSIPAQPGIFFRKALVESLTGPDGSLFDSSLRYTMDYDLWLRLFQINPPSLHIPEVVAYYRMWGKNKTGQTDRGMPYAEPEMSRVHRRYRNAPFRIHVSASIVVAVSSPENCSLLLNSLTLQQVPPGEVILVPRQASLDVKRLEEALDAFHAHNREREIDCYARVLPLSNRSVSEALNLGISDSTGELVVCVDDRSVFDSHALLRVFRVFANDSVGMSLCEDSNFWSVKLQDRTDKQAQVLVPFTARKIALFEVDGLPSGGESVTADVQALGHRIAECGWKVSRTEQVGITARPD